MFSMVTRTFWHVFPLCYFSFFSRTAFPLRAFALTNLRSFHGAVFDSFQARRVFPAIAVTRTFVHGYTFTGLWQGRTFGTVTPFDARGFTWVYDRDILARSLARIPACFVMLTGRTLNACNTQNNVRIQQQPNVYLLINIIKNPFKF